MIDAAGTKEVFVLHAERERPASVSFVDRDLQLLVVGQREALEGEDHALRPVATHTHRLALRFNFKLFRQSRVIDTETPDLRLVEANRSHEQYFGLSLSYSFSGGRSVDVKQTEEIQSYEKIHDKR